MSLRRHVEPTASIFLSPCGCLTAGRYCCASPFVAGNPMPLPRQPAASMQPRGNHPRLPLPAARPDPGRRSHGSDGSCGCGLGGPEHQPQPRRSISGVTSVLLLLAPPTTDHPLNLLLLGLFTVAITFAVGLTCAFIKGEGDPPMSNRGSRILSHLYQRLS